MSDVKKNVGADGRTLTEYQYNEAIEGAKEYFKGDDLAAMVWVSKYALKDSFGHIFEKSPEQMHWRIANELARIENTYPNPMKAQEIYDLLKEFRYIIPQGGPMTGIGNNLQIASLSNCFVIGHRNPADSYGGIIRIDEEQVQLMKRRGGVGHDLSHIRPTGSPVLNSALTSTGIVPFMERYSNSTREVAQDGRRGALMLSLSIKHPDAENFIDAKVETGKVTGANVSIKIDDEFMRAVLNNEKYVQKFPIDSDDPMYVKEIDARTLWNKIIHNAWKSAEPGVLFWDTIIRESVPDCYADEGFRTVSRAVLNSINRSLLPRPRRTRPRQNPAGQGSPSVPMSKINIRKQKQTEYSANLRFLSTKDPERAFRPLRRMPCLPLPPERKARDRENTALRRTKKPVQCRKIIVPLFSRHRQGTGPAPAARKTIRHDIHHHAGRNGVQSLPRLLRPRKTGRQPFSGKHLPRRRT